MAGEGQAKTKAAGLVGSYRLLGGQQLFKDPSPGIGDPVDLARSLGAPGGAGPSRPQGGPFASQRSGEGDRSRRRSGTDRLGADYRSR